MTPERAREIVKAINNRCFFKMGLADVIISLDGVTLAEMVEAAAMVRGGNAKAEPVDGMKTIMMVPDDRLIAAVYALDHYAVDSEPVLFVPDGKALRALYVARAVHAPDDAGEDEFELAGER